MQRSLGDRVGLILDGGPSTVGIESTVVDLTGADAVITPLTSLTFSANLLSGGVSSVGSSALLSAASRDGAGAEARRADIATALARLGEIPEDQRVIGNPAYNQLLIYDNGGFTVADGTVVPPPDAERRIRLSLASTFPNADGGIVNGIAVGGVVLAGNADLDTQTAGTKQVIGILQDAQFDGFDLTVTGAPVYLADLNDYLQGGMLSLGAAALALMAIVLLVMFRVRWRLLPLAAVVIGVIWSFSILGLIGIDLSLVTISGLPILIGMGIDFAIQIHNRIEEEVVLDKEAHPIAETVANLAPPLFAAAFTAVVAFVALRISKVPMIRDFGVLLGIGIFVLVIVGIVVPASALGIREHKKRTEVRPESFVEKIVVRLGSLPTSWGLPLLIVSALLFLGGVLVEGRAKIESDPIKWVDQSSQVVKDIGMLEDETGFSSTLGVLVAANNIYDQDVIDLVWDFTLDAEARDLELEFSDLGGDPLEEAEVEERHAIVVEQQHVAGVRVAGELAVAVHRAEVEPEDDLPDTIALGLREGLHRFEAAAGDVLRNDDLLAREVGHDVRDDHPWVPAVDAGQRALVRGLELVVELLVDALPDLPTDRPHVEARRDGLDQTQDHPEVLHVGPDRGGDPRVLDLDRDLAPVVQQRAVDLADGGGGDRRLVELREDAAELVAVLTLDDLAHVLEGDVRG